MPKNQPPVPTNRRGRKALSLQVRDAMALDYICGKTIAGIELAYGVNHSTAIKYSKLDHWAEKRIEVAACPEKMPQKKPTKATAEARIAPVRAMAAVGRAWRESINPNLDQILATQTRFQAVIASIAARPDLSDQSLGKLAEIAETLSRTALNLSRLAHADDHQAPAGRIEIHLDFAPDARAAAQQIQWDQSHRRQIEDDPDESDASPS